MPFSYEIDSARGLVRIAARGRITTAEALTTFDAVMGDPRIRAGMNFLSDHRELETVVSPAFVRAWISRIEDQGEMFKGSRAALVESSLVRYGMARMACLLAETTELDMRVFSKLDDALRWLEEKPMPGGASAESTDKDFS